MLFGFLSSSLLFNSVASLTKLHGFVLSDAHFDCCDQNGYHVYFFFLYIYILTVCTVGFVFLTPLLYFLLFDINLISVGFDLMVIHLGLVTK